MIAHCGLGLPGVRTNSGASNIVHGVLRVAQDDNSKALRLGRGFWRPGDLARQASIESMKPVYVPYWVFGGATHTYWTADTSQT